MKILQIGCGAMGAPIYKEICKKYSNIRVLEKNSAPFNEIFDVIIIAVKPQDFPSVAEIINKISAVNTVIFSIMAGISLQCLAKNITKTANFIRIMPNLGMVTENGIALVLDKINSPFTRQFIADIFSENSTIMYTKSDDEIDKYTPVTGSGMAYFLLLGKMIQDYAASNFEISQQDSAKIACKLLQNAAEMAQKSSFDEAIAKIASKGGITQCAIDNMQEGMRKSLENGLKSGEERAFELSKLLDK